MTHDDVPIAGQPYLSKDGRALLTSARLQEHGEHWCGSLVMFDPRSGIHSCAGPHDSPELVIEPGECSDCEETS